jgi:hypothetical protein
VNRARLATVLVSEALNPMEQPMPLTAATGPATTHLEDTERGSQDRGGTGQLLEAAAEQASDERGMIRDAHGPSGSGEGNKGKKAYKKKGKNVKCEKATNWAGSSKARTQPKNLFTDSAATCEKKRFLTAAA